MTSAAIGKVLNRVCDVVIWLMSANAMFQSLPTYALFQLPFRLRAVSNLLFDECISDIVTVVDVTGHVPVPGPHRGHSLMSA